MAENRQVVIAKFRNWLSDLDDDQVAALAENWGNIMDDAALDRVDSWVIAQRALAALQHAKDLP